MSETTSNFSAEGVTSPTLSSQFRGWGQHHVEDVGNTLSFDDAVDDSRRRGLRYSHKLSDKLAADLRSYADDAWSVSDITDEIAILRHLLGETLAQYDVAMQVEAKTDESKREKLILVETMRVQVIDDVGRVNDACKQLASIQHMRRGRMDTVIIGNLLSVVLRSLDNGVHEFAGALTEAGIEPQKLIDVISGKVVDGAKGEVAAVTGDQDAVPLISNKPSAVPTEDLIRAMLESVPITNEGVA